MNRTQRRAALLAVPALALVAACSAPTSTSPPSKPSAKASTGHQVTYKVTGTARSVSVTYTLEGTDTAQESGRPLPYTKSVPKPKGFSVLYLSAQNEGSTGDLTCMIVVDGKVTKTATSSGGYQVCQVSD